MILLLIIRKGNLAAVNRLLADPRVDPSARDNTAIIEVCARGHLEVVERLLADPRVNPSDVNNYALKSACANGHLAVVKRLLEDPRVSALANSSVYPVYLARKNNHIEILELLKAHGLKAHECVA